MAGSQRITPSPRCCLIIWIYTILLLIFFIPGRSELGLNTCWIMWLEKLFRKWRRWFFECQQVVSSLHTSSVSNQLLVDTQFVLWFSDVTGHVKALRGWLLVLKLTGPCCRGPSLHVTSVIRILKLNLNQHDVKSGVRNVSNNFKQQQQQQTI